MTLIKWPHIKFTFFQSLKLQKEWYQHRPQTAQVNKLNQTTLTTTLFFWFFLRRSIHEKHSRLCFAQASWYTSGIPMRINTNTSWKYEDDMYNLDHTQEAKSAATARPPEPNPTPNPAQRAQHGQIPRPTQHSAPTNVSILIFSRIEPHR